MILTNKMLSLFGGAAMAALTATSVTAQEVTLKLHQFLPAQANVPKVILDVWADKIETASEGRIKIDRFPSMQLGGKPPELLDQAIDGVADRWEAGELRAIVINSKAVFGEETIMPGFYNLHKAARIAEKFEGKTILTAQQVEDVVAYLQTLKDE